MSSTKVYLALKRLILPKSRLLGNIPKMLYFFIFTEIALGINLIAYVKAVQQRQLSAKLVKATFPIAILLLFVLPILPQPIIKLAPAAGLIVLAVAFIFINLGLAIGALGFYELKKHKTPALPTDWVPRIIVTEGIYGKIRHPLYLSAALIYTGYYLLFMGLYSLILILPMIYLITYVRAFVEERYILEQEFTEYLDYKQNTGMFLPRLG